MKVALLGLGWPPRQAGGGLDRYLEGLWGALRVDGVDAVALVTGGPPVPRPGVVVGGGPGDPLLRRLARYTRATLDVVPSADVVDVHFAAYAALPLALGLFRHLPLVVHFHGPWAAESRAAGDKRRLRLSAKHRVEGMVYRRAAQVVALSEAFRAVLITEYGLAPWSVEVIPPGVDLQRFAPGDRAAARAHWGIAPEARLLVTVRRLVPRMGLDVMIEAFSAVAGTHEDVELLIVGEGPDRALLEEMVRRSGHAARIHLVGAVTDDRLVDAYCAADISLVPSLQHEGFGLVALEALACGVPVIASSVGGLPDALRGLGDGLLVPPGEPGALANRIGAAFDGSLALPPSARCREHAERFTWKRAASANVDVYRRAIKGTSPRKTRVAVIDHCARLSGAEIGLLRLLPSLSRTEPHVILAEDGPLVSRLRDQGISVEVLSLDEGALNLSRSRVTPRALPWRGALNVSAYALRLAARLRTLRPDLVHTYSLKAGHYGGVAARLARIPAVWQVHDRISPDYLPPAAVQLVRWALPVLADEVIVSSRSVLDTLDLRSTGASIIPYALPANAYRDGATTQRATGALRVGMVGRISPWKGQGLFVEAFARAFPTGAERAVLVGSPLFGEEDELERIVEMIDRLGLSDRVDLLGFRSDVAEHLRSFDVLVHASVIPEPFGQVITEGMAAGLPVLAADLGGPTELIEDGVDGLLFRSGDADDLAAAMRRLAGDPALRSRLGRAARRRAERFRSELLAGELEDVYERVGARRGHGAGQTSRPDS